MKKKGSIHLLLAVFMLLISAASVHASTGYTYTRYPIVLVGGILDYDNLLIMDYYYGVDWELERSAWTGPWWNRKWQPVNYIMLSPLQGTEARGLDLAEQIEDLMATLNVEKINIIAHSHGSTTSRVAMKLLAEKALNEGKPNPIASLTTIAGPHYGTASADASTLPFWPEPLLKFVYSVLNFAGDVLATLTNISYDTLFPPEAPAAHPQDYIGNQDMAQVAYDFTQEGIEQFNIKYPCAGIPQGGTFGRVNNETPKYGSDGAPGAFAGNGLGQALSVTDPHATLYYSWTGDVAKPVTNGGDILDLSMVATWLLSELYCNFGHITRAEDITGGDVSDFLYFIYSALESVFTNGGVPSNAIATDAFIPVSSAKFGNFLAIYPWNHIDEQNQTWGLLGPDATSPIEVFRTHANRLYLANR